MRMELPAVRSVPCRLVGPWNCCLTAVLKSFGACRSSRDPQRGVLLAGEPAASMLWLSRSRNMDREIVAYQQRQCCHQAAGRDGPAVGSSSAKAEHSSSKRFLM